MHKAILWSMTKIIKCLTKSKLKFSDGIKSKLYWTFKSPCNLIKPPICLTLPCSQGNFLVKSPKISSAFWILLCRNFSLTKPLILAPFYWKRLEHFTVINLSHITCFSLSTIPSCLLSANKQAMTFDENFIATLHQLT